ncbi:MULTISPECIES: hypothetical protein [unclassified Methylobacterium]|uniref:hypothetical protein n=1 Tax=unclassified Methylobacterium TaxID=2615210 RepID=UPI000A757246|nr:MULTISPECIES: hypothetical protein [unclassified Methylobacterium]
MLIRAIVVLVLSTLAVPLAGCGSSRERTLGSGTPTNPFASNFASRQMEAEPPRR